MNSDQTPVNGPFAVGVTAIPAGVELDVSDYLRHFLLALADEAEENPDSLIESLVELADAQRAASGRPLHSAEVRERDETADALVAKYSDRGRIPVYGQQVMRLTERLWRLVRPRPVPAQRSDESEAA